MEPGVFFLLYQASPYRLKLCLFNVSSSSSTRVSSTRRARSETSTGRFTTRSTSAHKTRWSRRIPEFPTTRRTSSYDTSSTTYCDDLDYIVWWPWIHIVTTLTTYCDHLDYILWWPWWRAESVQTNRSGERECPVRLCRHSVDE